MLLIKFETIFSTFLFFSILTVKEFRQHFGKYILVGYN